MTVAAAAKHPDVWRKFSPRQTLQRYLWFAGVVFVAAWSIRHLDITWAYFLDAHVQAADLFGRMYPTRLPPLELLERVDLVEKAKTTVNKLSGGQKQRFTLAASLVNDPEIVFLDEPTTGLDPQARRNVWDLIERMHGEGRTVVLTTHYMEEAQVLCQRVAIMDAGLIVALDTPTNLVLGLPVPYRIRLQASAPLPVGEMERLDAAREVHARDGDSYTVTSTHAAKTLPDLLALVGRIGVTLDHLEVITATLEDVFLELTEKELRE